MTYVRAENFEDAENKLGLNVRLVAEEAYQKSKWMNSLEDVAIQALYEFVHLTERR